MKNDEKILAETLAFSPEMFAKVKILDCTLRDGGAVNSSNFSEKTARAVYDACADSRLDYVELGYKNSRNVFNPSNFGELRFCDEDTINRIVGDYKRDIKIAVMADAGKADYHKSIVRKSRSLVDMVRVATYVKDIDIALDIVKHASDMGYETSINIMAVSTLTDKELDEAIVRSVESDADIIYMMDSFGALTPEAFRNVFVPFELASHSCGKKVGVHIHDSIMLAFANTIEAICKGADFVDSSICGLGRGAGNCRTEMLAQFIGKNIRPILECAECEIEPLRKDYRWGCEYAYVLTGFANVHPSIAIDSIKQGETLSHLNEKLGVLY